MKAISEREAREIDAQTSIMMLLKISEFDYSNFQFEQGIKYLKQYLSIVNFPSAYQQLYENLSRSKAYWSWWKAQWTVRDEMFLRTWVNEDASPALRLIYTKENDVKMLLKEIRPHSVIMYNTAKNYEQVTV